MILPRKQVISSYAIVREDAGLDITRKKLSWQEGECGNNEERTLTRRSAFGRGRLGTYLLGTRFWHQRNANATLFTGCLGPPYVLTLSNLCFSIDYIQSMVQFHVQLHNSDTRLKSMTLPRKVPGQIPTNHKRFYVGFPRPVVQIRPK